MDKLGVLVFNLENVVQEFLVVTSILIFVECSTSEFIALKSFYVLSCKSGGKVMSDPFLMSSLIQSTVRDLSSSHLIVCD